MRKKRAILLSLSLLSATLFSCNSNSSNKYKTEKINVYYTNSNNNTTCDIRYYNDSVIPYISIKNYNKLLYNGRTYPEGRDRFDISKNGDTYTITVAGGYSAVFDVKNNKIESDDLWNFKNTNLNGYGDNVSVSYDGLPFIKVKKVEYDKESVKTVIDLNKYNLKIYGDDNDVYVPIAFASDLFSNENILQGAYNNKDLYITNFTENESLNSFGKNYYDSIFSKPITKEYAEYVYNELCLDYDYFVGRPGRSSLEAYYDLSNGLDKALESRELGRTIKEYIKSTDLIKVLAGTTLLGHLRNDGGHSSYDPLDTIYYDTEVHYPSWLTTEVGDEVTSLLVEEKNKNYEEITNSCKSVAEHSYVRTARSEMLGKTNGELKGFDTYTKVGDTAYIHIDGFMGEIALLNEWNDYYNGKSEDIPFGDDFGGAVGAMFHGVTSASADSEIKHIIIDLASNTGGSTDEMLYMIGILTGNTKLYYYNRVSNRYITATYELDFNLDKVFDEKDEEMLQLLNDKDISVLTTKNGFSCGGISPVYLHEEGLFTIGEECGGGSCSIYIQYDGYGNQNRVSSPSQMTTKNNISIDAARKTVCDYTLTFPELDNGRNYSSLYDTNKLRDLINNHYSM